MIFELTDLRAEQLQRSDEVGRGAAPRALRELAANKRASMRGPLVPAPMTSAHPCWGRWSRWVRCFKRPASDLQGGGFGR